jgi:hypothetical protein
VLPRLLLSVRHSQSELEPQFDAIGGINCFSVRPKMERVFAIGHRHARFGDAKVGGLEMLWGERRGFKASSSLDTTDGVPQPNDPGLRRGALADRSPLSMK